jgi:hypothetical protein
MKITPAHVAGAMFSLVGISAFESDIVGVAYTLTCCVAWAVTVVAMEVARKVR